MKRPLYKPLALICALICVLTMVLGAASFHTIDGVAWRQSRREYFVGSYRGLVSVRYGSTNESGLEFIHWANVDGTYNGPSFLGFGYDFAQIPIARYVRIPLWFIFSINVFFAVLLSKSRADI